MEVIQLPWYVLVILSLFISLLFFYIHFLFVSSKYWSKRKIPHVKPNFLLGNTWKIGIIEHISDTMRNLYMDNVKEKIVGFWMYTKPTLLVRDLDLIKRVLIRDFNSFRDRGVEIDTSVEPLAGHLFMLKGKRWRNLRVKLTPTFTSGKMKMMFPTMAKCSVELQKHLRKHAERGDEVEVKDLMSRFTTDVISSVAFGIETNSLENPKSEFREFGKKIFRMNWKTVATNMLIMTFPGLVKTLKLRLIPKDVTEFFINAVRDTINYREQNDIRRNDFLQLLIQLMRAGKIEDVDKTPVDDLTDEEIVRKFSLNEAAAQCFLFFAAGFEASSSVLTFALYELALNPDLQTKLREEIDSTLGSRSSEITYEAVNEIQYLDMVVQETMRKYPSVANIQRVTTVDYNIPELGVTIDKGTTVMISAIGLHYDPNFYPDPTKFDPERFSPEQRAIRHPLSFLPFGEGPRNCIGNRFALMQIKVCLTSIVRNFNIEVCKTTPIPMVYNKTSFIPSSKTGVPLSFKVRP